MSHRIESIEWIRKWPVARVEFELTEDGIPVGRRTSTRRLSQPGRTRRKLIDPNGDAIREPRALVAALERIVTDTGSCSDLAGFADAIGESRHQRMTPDTPWHNGRIEYSARILAEKFLDARTWHSEHDPGAALDVRSRHDNAHRHHGGQRRVSVAPSTAHDALASSA